MNSINVNKQFFYNHPNFTKIKEDLKQYLNNSEDVFKCINDLLTLDNNMHQKTYLINLPHLLNVVQDIFDDNFIDEQKINQVIDKDLLINKEDRQFLTVTYSHHFIANYLVKNKTTEEILNKCKKDINYLGWLFHNASTNILLAKNFVKEVLDFDKGYESELKFFCNNFRKLINLHNNNVNIWNVIKNDDEIETLYPAFVWAKERSLIKIHGEKALLNEKISFLNSTKEQWLNISTEKTNNIDLYSRLVIFIARTKDESFFLNFLKKNKIKDFNLYIKDFDFLTYENKQKQLFPKQEKRYQIADVLIDKRFITSLNYLYAENKVMLSDILNTKPPERLLLKDIKFFYKVLNANITYNFESSEELLKNYLEKKMLYSNNFNSLKNIFFPINTNKLNVLIEESKSRNEKEIKFTTLNDFFLILDYNKHEKEKSNLNNFEQYIAKNIDWENKLTINYDGKEKIYKNKIWFIILKASLNINNISKDFIDQSCITFVDSSMQDKIEIMNSLKDFLKDKKDDLIGHIFMKKFVFLLNNDSIKLPEEFFDEDWEKINNKIILNLKNKTEKDVYEKNILLLQMNTVLKESKNIKKDKIKI